MTTIKKARWQAGLTKHFDVDSIAFVSGLVALAPAFGAGATMLFLFAARWIGGAQ